MKKCLYCLAIIMVASIYPWPGYAKHDLGRHEKEIWIDQKNQVGAAYQDGVKLLEFPILSGDDETPTPPGTYVIGRKDKNYYSRTYKQPMPYALFFDLKGMRAIHEGDLPDKGEKEEWATHGCIHVEEPYIKQLFNWAEQGRTVVIIAGHRIGPPPGESEEIEPQEIQGRDWPLHERRDFEPDR